jgi:endo-1,4-beta-xylanase
MCILDDRLSSDTAHQHTLGRRQFLAGAAAAALGGIVPSKGSTEPPDSLKARAAVRGILYGCMVTRAMLQSSPDFCAAVVREAGIIVPGNEMKWASTQPKRGPADYRDSDAIGKFASENGLALRGHTAAWHVNLPAWVTQDLAAPGGRDLLDSRVRSVVGHFQGRVKEWDVVNEAIEPRDGLGRSLRNSQLYRAGGPTFIADCFHAAHEADPAAMLVYNEYGLEYQTVEEDRRREATLRLLSDLKRQGVPLYGLGIQCHLKVGNRFNPKIFRKFLADVAALGLNIRITEFDIDDQRLPGDIAERDRQVADHARTFLEVALDERSLNSLLTWGLSDRYTWLNAERPRSDGVKKRPLPLDENMARKPLWLAMAQCFDNAPMRGD